MERGRRTQVAEETVRRFAEAVRSARLHGPRHPLVERALDSLAESLVPLVADRSTLTIALTAQQVVVDDTPLSTTAATETDFIGRLQALGIERIAFDREVTPGALKALVLTLAHPERKAGDPALQSLPNIRVACINLDERVESSTGDVAAIRRFYADAVKVAGSLWDIAEQEGQADPRAATQLIDELAEAVCQNPTTLVALTALKAADDYMFTHMVNVSILTMAQARALDVEGSLLREFGLAALMHDIGKVRTPNEILAKPEKLTNAEFAIMRMHVIDGAEILRRTPEMPALAAVVAFEHHLRLDGSGYPVGITRSSLNLGTMLCSISDVHDAMRSYRAYQESFPTDRILAVLTRNDGLQFDQHLVRRFSQLMGIYPPGSVVQLNTGELGVVIRVYAPDPSRPRVRVIAGADGQKLLRPYDVNLWETSDDSDTPGSVISPMDPGLIGVDPLTYL